MFSHQRTEKVERGNLSSPCVQRLGSRTYLLSRALPALVLCVVGAASSLQTLSAQTTAGKILGVVQDQSQAVIPGVAVKVTNTGTNASQTRTTNNLGYYELLDLDPGKYDLEAEYRGFKKYVQRGIILQVNQEARIDITLQPGEIREVVEVTGQAALLETTTSTVGQVINQREIIDLPLNGRNPFQLTFLSAGVSGLDGGTGAAGGFQAGLFGGVIASSTINGGRQGSTEVYMDGAPNTYADNGPGTLGVAYSPSVDSVQEFKVITNNMSAEFGNAGAGVINIVTRSGTNSFHGNIFEFHRNSVLDSNDFFANKAGIKLSSFKRNQFGGNLGGPIRHNKTFFFVTYEGTRERKLTTTTRTVPIQAWRDGIFSDKFTGNMLPPDCLGRQFDEGQLFNPYSLQTCPDGSVVRDPFAGNVIPQAMWDRTATEVLKFWPAPTILGRTDRNFVASGSGINTSDQFDIRLDHNLSERQRVMGRYAQARGFFAPPNFFNNVADPAYFPRPTGARLAVFEHSINLNSTTLLTNSVSYNRNKLITQVAPFQLTDIAQPEALNNIVTGHQFPWFAFGSVSSLSSGFVGSRQVAERYSLRSTLAKIQGRHSLKFGSQIDLLRTNEGAPAAPTGFFINFPLFTNGPGPFDTGGAAIGDFAGFLLGLTPALIISQDVFRAMQSWYYGFYVQDDIKVSRRLTLNVGVRYDLSIPATERHDRATWFDFNAKFPNQLSTAAIQATIADAQAQGIDLTQSDLANLTTLRGGLRFAGDDPHRHWFNTDTNNIQPRFGFAYQMTPNTVIRGGAGVFFGPSNSAANGTSVAFNINGFGGFESTLTTIDFVNPLCRPASEDPTRRDCVQNPFPDGLRPLTGKTKGLLTGFDPAVSIISMERDAPSPPVYNWNFTIERMLPGGILVGSSYVGSRALRFATGNTAIDQFNQLPRATTLKYRTQLYENFVLNPFEFDGIVQDPNSPLSASVVPLSRVLQPLPHMPTGAFNTNVPLNGKSSYHSFQLRIEKAFSHGLAFLVSYTNSKLIDNGEGGLYTIGWHGFEPQDRYNYSLEKSLSAQDVSQRFVVSYIYELPFGRAKRFSIVNPVLNHILGGWQTNGILTLGRGTPLPWGYIAVDPSFGQPFSLAQRMDRICDPKLSGPVVNRLDKYFNTDCFKDPAPFALGTAPRTDPRVRFPGIRQMDFSVFKNFNLTERWKLQFRTEFFNFTNTPRFFASRGAFGPGGASIFPKSLNPAFGTLDIQGNDPRQVQFGLRISF